MIHAQTCNSQVCLCGEKRGGDSGTGICIDSRCDHCDNLVANITCRACLDRIAMLKEILSSENHTGTTKT